MLPVLLAAALAIAAAGGASASSPAVITLSPASHPLATSFLDGTAFTGGPPGASLWFARAVASAATVVRLGTGWPAIAPTRPADAANPADPAYQWTALDQQVEEATAAGLAPIISLTGAPIWAQAKPIPKSASPGAWEPDAAQYRLFAQALATRYSGHFPDPLHPGSTLPAVRYFQAWNEENLSQYLAPQWKRVGGTWIAVGPVLYRALLNAFYFGIKAAQPHALVISGGTAPFGDPPGGARIAPAFFDRVLLCVSASLAPLSCPDPAHFDVLAHHPYAVGDPYAKALNVDDVSISDLAKLEAPLAAAERSGRALPAGTKPIWVTEVSYDSKPPDPHAVPMATFERWTAETLYELWSEGVSLVTWYLIEDQPPEPTYADSYQSGMYFINGKAKPAQRAFRFPLVIDRRGGGVPVVWTRVPATGTLRIEGDVGGHWVVLATAHVTRDEVLVGHLPASAGEAFRALVGTQTSLIWRS
jgi:hypothetical protein